VRLLLLLAIVVSPGLQAQDASALRERHAALRTQLSDSAFGHPLHVESRAEGGAHQGEIYAVLEQPFTAVKAALGRPANWCHVLLLQVNVKRCVAEAPDTLAAFITRKARDTVDDAYRVTFRYAPPVATADYLRVDLNADSGPMGTRGYRIVLEATPLDSQRSFMHLSYAYTLGWMARLAMDVYLSGSGDRPGFSVEGGERGVVERGAMRHYLAIEAYLHSQNNLEARLRRWYAATERYPQLREAVDAEEYLAMKRGG
jgi:hypothetical protein